MRGKTAVVAALVLATGFAASALAQPSPGPLESRLEARKVVVEAGKERLVDAADAKPGDVIEYAATYRNRGKEPIRNLEATLPIPRDTELLAGSARPAPSTGSLEGTAFVPLPIRRPVTRDGKAVLEDVPLREYRALRWRVPQLSPEQSLTFTARVRVADDRPPAAAPPKEPPR
jgi:uncharacterized repeat protein (TIGR01451 family)